MGAVLDYFEAKGLSAGKINQLPRVFVEPQEPVNLKPWQPPSNRPTPVPTPEPVDLSNLKDLKRLPDNQARPSPLPNTNPLPRTNVPTPPSNSGLGLGKALRGLGLLLSAPFVIGDAARGVANLVNLPTFINNEQVKARSEAKLAEAQKKNRTIQNQSTGNPNVNGATQANPLVIGGQNPNETYRIFVETTSDGANWSPLRATPFQLRGKITSVEVDSENQTFTVKNDKNETVTGGLLNIEIGIIALRNPTLFPASDPTSLGRNTDIINFGSYGGNAPTPPPFTIGDKVADRGATIDTTLGVGFDLSSAISAKNSAANNGTQSRPTANNTASIGATARSSDNNQSASNARSSANSSNNSSNSSANNSSSSNSNTGSSVNSGINANISSTPNQQNQNDAARQQGEAIQKQQQQLKEQQKQADEARARQQQIELAQNVGLGVIGATAILQPLLNQINTQTNAANQRQNAKDGTCDALNSPTCTRQVEDNIAGKVNNGTNPSTDAKLNTIIGNQVAQDGLLAQIIALLTSNFSKLFNFLNSQVVDRVLTVTTFALTLHNALMLSQSLGDTLGLIIDNTLQVFGNTYKDTEGNQIPFSQYLGANIQQTIINIIGQENYLKLSETLAVANRIYQAGMNVASAVQSILDSAASVAQATGINVAKIGNALRDESVVSPRAYTHMDDTPAGNRATTLGRFEQLTTTISDLDSKAQNLVTITSAPIQIKDAIKQSKEDIKAFNDARDVNSEANQSLKQEKLDQIKALKPITEATIQKRDDDT